MIWRLMRRDTTWQWTPLAGILVLLPGIRPGTMETFVFMTLGMIGCLSPAFYTYCTLYEGALPIPARDLWLSRVMSLLAAMWLPVLTASAVLALSGRAAPILIEAAAVYTVLVMAAKCFRRGQFSAPPWMRFAGIMIFMQVAVFLLLDLERRLVPAAGILAVCGLASAALFLIGWRSIPKAFQIAPLWPAARASRKSRGPSRFLWSPVFRSIYHWQMWIMLFFLLSQLAIGSLFGGYFFVPLFLQATQAPRRWLSPLPVASRTLFRLTIAPLAAAILIANVIGIFADPEHPLTVRTRIVELAAELALLCLMLWLSELTDWRGISKFRRSVRAIPLAAGMAGPLIAMVVGSKSHDRAWMFDKLPAVLSQNGWLLALALLAPLGALYGLAEKTYAEMEYPAAGRVTEPLQ
jgi:hypothetical protein